MADRITAAFIYGSFARGSEIAESDVDVMIAGDAGLGEIVAALGQSEDRSGRKINPLVFTAEEFGQRVKDGERFVTSVLREPKTTLVGCENGLGQDAGRRQT